MDAKPYNELSATALLALCIYREARGESIDGKRGVAHVIANRANQPSWWNSPAADYPTLWHATILKPWQFSSFNSNDPNSNKWPHDDDPAWTECLSVASGVYLGMDMPDPTDGAQYYYDTSIGWPKAWGSESEYTNTFNTGRLKFWRHERPHANSEAVEDAASG